MEIMSAGPEAVEGAIEKALSSGDIIDGDGALVPKQREDYQGNYKTPSNALVASATMEFLYGDTAKIDMVHDSAPMTDFPAENNEADGSSPMGFGGTVDVTLKRTRMSLFISYDTVRRMLPRGVEATPAIINMLMNRLKKRGTYDSELVAEGGDVDAYGAGTDRLSLLLKGFNGWNKQSEQARSLDYAGSDIDADMFLEGFKLTPDGMKTDPLLSWELSPSAYISFLKKEKERMGVLGDAIVAGDRSDLRPMMLSVIKASSISSRQPLTTVAPTPALKVSTAVGFMTFDTASRYWEANVNNKGNFQVDLLAKLRKNASQTKVTASMRQVAWAINEVLKADVNYGTTYQNFATALPDGHLQIKTPTTGAWVGPGGARIVVLNNATNINAALGIPNATYDGLDTNGTIPQGTYIRLCNPTARVFAQGVDGPRVSVEFDRKKDRFELIKYEAIHSVWQDLENVLVIRNAKVA